MRRIVYKIYLAACAMALMVASSTFAQTLDYSNYNASYEIIGSDTAMIKVTVEGVSFNFVKVEGGCMDLGKLGFCKIDTFWLMETEVTNELASLFFEDAISFGSKNGLSMKVRYGEIDYSSDDIMASPFVMFERLHWFPTSYSFGRKVYDELVYYIPEALCDLLNDLDFIIPTTKQWTYAARGGNKSMHYTYSGSDNQDEVAWYSSNSQVLTKYGSTTKAPHPVKSKSPNELGLYDMSGNVCEFTCDDVIMGAAQFVISEQDLLHLSADERRELYQDSKGKVICGGCCFSSNCYPSMITDIEKNDGKPKWMLPQTTGIRLALLPQN